MKKRKISTKKATEVISGPEKLTAEALNKETIPIYYVETSWITVFRSAVMSTGSEALFKITNRTFKNVSSRFDVYRFMNRNETFLPPHVRPSWIPFNFFKKNVFSFLKF